MKRKTKLMFQALALLQSEKPTLKTSTLLSLHGGNLPLISLFDTKCKRFISPLMQHHNNFFGN